MFITRRWLPPAAAGAPWPVGSRFVPAVMKLEGKRYSGKIRKGNPWVTGSAQRSCLGSLQDQQHLPVGSAGSLLAIVALAHPSRSSPTTCSNAISPITSSAPSISTRSSPHKLRSGLSNAYGSSDIFRVSEQGGGSAFLITATASATAETQLYCLSGTSTHSLALSYSATLPRSRLNGRAH